MELRHSMTLHCMYLISRRVSLAIASNSFCCWSNNMLKNCYYYYYFCARLFCLTSFYRHHRQFDDSQSLCSLVMNNHKFCMTFCYIDLDSCAVAAVILINHQLVVGWLMIRYFCYRQNLQSYFSI